MEIAKAPIYTFSSLDDLSTLIFKYKKLMGILNPDMGSMMNARLEDVVLYNQADQIFFKLLVFESMAKSDSPLGNRDKEMIIKFLFILIQYPKVLPKEKDYLCFRNKISLG